ncbi:unnamed protein product [Tilletia controversa]|uniref:Uncharacterized protein n=3 Tax=Tilletia TaxID=13289 RepID=A0A8X7N081_9BASI|nr:hypothetical protein CF336_g275 [Tilletia laevis]KAE8202389.1 hypothetical protein CF328_g2242 [Tilletia controversa]KAE8265545.1 hypothetical protein A4X03_0g194 [Tilletia caries]KAE8206817.1 hypothetical protein CF335_g1596 [Tilletia laevis]KAE8255329.1 hypothetical protein A4X06_0g472 [Tilletia controversa]
MVSSAGRVQIVGVIPALFHIAALALLLLVLVSPTPLPFGPSLIKIVPVSLNVSQTAAPTSSASFPGVNITLSNNTVAQVKPRALHHRRMRRVVLRRDGLVGTVGANATSSDQPNPSGPPPSSPASEPSPTPASQTSTVAPTLTTPTAPTTTNANSTPSGTASPSETAVPSGTSSIKMNFGPLGACFWSADGVRDCSSPSLNPTYNLTALKSATQGSISTAGLPGSLSGSTRSAILLASVIVLLISCVLAVLPIVATLNPDTFGAVLDAAPYEQHFRTAKSLMAWALALICVLLVGAAVSLRFTLNSAVNAFNAANQKISLPPSLTDGSQATNVGLHAQIGNSFGFLWIVSFYLGIMFWVERRRARQAEAIAQARTQIEAAEARRIQKASKVEPVPPYQPARPERAYMGDSKTGETGAFPPEKEIL